MGCRSDYMEANEREAESKHVAELLVYLLPAIGKDVPADVAHAANEYYGDTKKLDEHTALLCDTLANLPDKEKDKVVYDGKIAKARALAEWWDAHQEADRKREIGERADKKSASLKKAALEKLTPAERKALGL